VETTVAVDFPQVSIRGRDSRFQKRWRGMRRCENNTESAKKKTRLLAHHSPELHNRWTGCTAACRVRGYYGERNLQSKHILSLFLFFM